jgi:hypothetical protein
MILGGDTPWLRQLAETPLSERMALLNALIVTEFRAALLMDDRKVLPPEESHFALGLTSLGATEIQERLEVILGRRIDSASLFDNPTIRHLTAFLRSQVLPEFFAALFPVEDGSAIPENAGRRCSVQWAAAGQASAERLA